MSTERFARIETERGPRFARLSGVAHLLDGAPWSGGRPTGETLPLETARFLVPSEASKIVCIGQNYARHAAELGKPVPVEPLLFIKPSTALNAHRSPIVLPEASHEVHYEAELALVIGERLTRVSEAEAARGLFAVTCFNDVTARDIQRREVQHTRAKSYDTFACAGPWMVSGLSPNDLRITCRLNGKVVQDSRTSDMVHGAAKLVAFISNVMTLLPGDVISTGTPAGVGKLSPGDVVEVELEGVGTLVNPVQG